MENLTEREQHLLQALLHILLFLGNKEDEVIKKTKDLLYFSSTNPKTDYSRPKTMIAG